MEINYYQTIWPEQCPFHHQHEVAAMLQSLLKFDEMPKYLDATDGLAVAVCHVFSKGVGEHNKSKGGGWKSFIKDQSHRVKKHD